MCSFQIVGARVSLARVVGDSTGPKIDVFKYKNKTGYRRRQGHRQKYTTIEITSIVVPGAAKPKAKAAPKAKAEPKPEAPPEAEATSTITTDEEA